MTKKIISLILVGLLSFQSLLAIDLGVDGYSNETKANSWNNSLSGGTFVTGGSYSFKYKSTGNSKPWLVAAPPSLKVGCKGFSFNGGFMSLIGLDDIELQFQDASAAFAFGFMSALEFTLPEIASTIKEIQAWARRLQEFIKNACNFGKIFASGKGGEGTGVIGEWLQVKSGELGIDKAMETLQEPIKKVDAFAEDLRKAISSNDTNKSSSISVVKKTQMIKIYKAGSGVSLFTEIFGNNFPEIDTPKMQANLKDFFQSEKIEDIAIEKVNDTVFQEKVGAYLLARILVGELYANKQSIKTIKDMVDDDGNFKEVNLKTIGEKLILNNAPSGTPGLKSTFIGSPYDAEHIATALMGGFNHLSDTIIDNTAKVNNNNFIYIDTLLDMVSNTQVQDERGKLKTIHSPTVGEIDSTKVKIKVVLLNSEYSGKIDAKFEGYLESSKRVIHWKVTGKDEFKPDWNTITAPNAIPSLNVYLGTLSKMYIKNPANQSVQLLIDKLAKLNAYNAAVSFLSMIESKIKYQKNNIEMDTNFENVDQYLEQLAEKVKKVKLALDQNYKVEEFETGLIDTFKSLNEEIAKSVTKAGKSGS